MNASHPELEVLAGLLDEPDGGAGEPWLAAHVGECAQCQADLRALRTVQATLRALPAVPMPDDVATRLESAVRAGAVSPAGQSVTSLPLHSRRRRAKLQGELRPGRRGTAGWQLPHVTAAAGVAVLMIVALGTGIAVMVTRGGNSNTHTAASTAAGGRAASTAAIVTTSGADYVPDSIRSQVAALVVQRVPDSAARYSGLQPLAGHAAAGMAVPSASRSSAMEPSAAAAPSATAGDTFGQAASPAPEKALAGDLAVAPAPTAPAGPLADAGALQACVRTLNGGTPIEPVLVDYARFDGRPATIIVLPSTQSPGTLVVWVEPNGSDCATKGETAYYGTLSASP